MIDALRSVLRRSDGVVAAYLFGSAASGRQHSQSDVDIAVRLDRSSHPTRAIRFQARLDLLAALRTAARRDVDLVILNDAPPQFAREIMTSGIRLLVNDAEAEHAELRVTLSRAADIAPFLRRARETKLRAIAP